jgi:rubrerythrin
MAIQTEQNGTVFYKTVAESAASESVRQFAQFMAEEEARHEETFRHMLANVRDRRQPEAYPGELANYVQVLLENKVLPDGAAARTCALNCQTDTDAIDLAIQFEKDTILFMYEMRELIPESERGAVDQMIAEEKRHVIMLTERKGSVG